jgi:hypothetical protein
MIRKEFIAYLQVREHIYYIKNINATIMKLLYELDFGDSLNIAGLGQLELINVFLSTDLVDDVKYIELGILCNPI